MGDTVHVTGSRNVLASRPVQTVDLEPTRIHGSEGIDGPEVTPSPMVPPFLMVAPRNTPERGSVVNSRVR